MRRWVVDASPLIFLAKLQRLDLLERGADEVLVPAAVLREIGQRQDEASEKVAEAQRVWLLSRSVEVPQTVALRTAGLDRGEAEAIALALEVGAEHVILDDLGARQFARRVGLAPLGTLGLLLAAKLRGEIEALRDEIEKLRQSRFRVSEALVRAVLESAGEL